MAFPYVKRVNAVESDFDAPAQSHEHALASEKTTTAMNDVESPRRSVTPRRRAPEPAGVFYFGERFTRVQVFPATFYEGRRIQNLRAKTAGDCGGSREDEGRRRESAILPGRFVELWQYASPRRDGGTLFSRIRLGLRSKDRERDTSPASLRFDPTRH